MKKINKINKIKIAFWLNIAIVILEIFANAWMMSGIAAKPGASLTATRWRSFRYFTVDSNVMMGVISLVVAIELYRVLKGVRKTLPQYCAVLMHIGATGTTLTMLVTLFFLLPTQGVGVLMRSNFFLHVVNPVVSIVAALFFTKFERKYFKATFLGVVPMAVYAVYYMGAVLTHYEDGVIAKGYDWYGFLVMGVSSAAFVIPLMLLITYLISLGLWKLNQVCTKKD